MPQIAAWGKTQIDNALGAAGTSASAVGLDKLAGNGVLYHGLSVMGGGATLAGMVLAAITVFVIERQFMRGAFFALAGAILTYFGLMHGENVGIGVTPLVALSYLFVFIILVGVAKFATVPAKNPEPVEAEPEAESQPA